MNKDFENDFSHSIEDLSKKDIIDTQNKYPMQDDTYFRMNTKNKYPMQDVPYFREIPCNNNLLQIYWLADTFGIIENDSDLIGALFLSWLRDKKIKFTKEEKKLFSKPKNVIEFYDDVVIKDESEKQFYFFLKEISMNNKLELNELEKWNTDNPIKIHDFYMKLRISIQLKFAETGLLSEEKYSDEEEKAFERIRNERNDNFVERAMKDAAEEEKRLISKYTTERTKHINITSVLTTAVARIGDKIIFSKELKEEVKKIAGLKKFLLDFSAIKNRSAEEVILWGDYLIIAKLFGIANLVSEEFKNLYPELTFPNLNVSLTRKVTVLKKTEILK